MASIWKGALTFGLVNVQVKVHPATQDNDISFHQVHAADGGRIRYQRVCEVCKQVVEYREIAKAYEAPSGKTVTISEADLKTLPAGRSREIDVLEFVPAEQVDPILFDRTYYLEPDPSAVRPYVLLREALQNTDRVAIAHVALRQKTRLAALRVYQDVIVLQTMLWRDEIREPNFETLRTKVDVREQEVKMANSLIETLESDFDPEQYTDEYREELMTLLQHKLETGEGVVEWQKAGEPAAAAASGNVVDLMSALQASIERGQRSKTADSSDGAADESQSESKPARRAPAKKTAGKKAAATKDSEKPAAKKKARKGA